jgi:glycosyltransferase involved in cell wall biosynthesis
VGERLLVIVPAYNEAPVIASVVTRIRQALPEARTLVVSDGSTDDTAVRARQAGAVVAELPVNLGIGGAVQTGYRYALRHGFDVAIQIDGDGQHDPAEVGRLLAPLRQGRADLVVGSRWLGRGEYVAPMGRRVGMHLLAAMVRWRTGQPVTDTTSGFRAAGPRAIRLFAHHYPADFPEVESLVLARRHGLRLLEVPVAMRPRAHGRSSIAGLRSAYYMARVGLALVVDAVRGESA